jgi:arginyl-tRNA synthetase
MLRFLGHRVIGDNHIGDWGTQFGMILLGYKRHLDEAAFAKHPVAELERLYRVVNDLAKRDPAIATAAREETARLHAGDEENRRLWESILPRCRDEINRIYRRLGVEFDHALGESFYDPMLSGVIHELKTAGIAEPSQGALCIFFNEELAPAIIQKSDGAYTYATTDLATIKYRVEHFHPHTIVYVVDQRQADHFRQLFAAVRRWGFRDVELVHVSFGTILGNDGRPFRTREGGIVGLEDLLDEGVQRARRIVDENSPELSDVERAAVAEAVGIGAIKYADLSQNRTSDYVFDWDKMLAMQGNTGTYLQYAYARIKSIFRKGQLDPDEIRAKPIAIRLQAPAERALAVALVRFAETVDAAAYEYRPNLLTNYLFELADRFSTFYNACPVLKADDDSVRRSRLQLCDLAARVLAGGLHLLGIRTIEKM